MNNPLSINNSYFLMSRLFPSNDTKVTRTQLYPKQQQGKCMRQKKRRCHQPRHISEEQNLDPIHEPDHSTAMGQKKLN